MKNIVGFIFILLFGATVISCEELIEPDFPTHQIGTDQVFNDSQTAYSALSGLYASLRDNSVLSGNNYGLGSLLGSYTDDLDCYYNDQNGYMDIFTNSIQPSNGTVLQLWNSTYQQIYAANAIIEGINNSLEIPESDKDSIKGEALFIRSLLYYWLQQLFNEIPYTDRTDFEYNRTLSKQSKEDLLHDLENDLNSAQTLLSSEYRNPERIYPNRQTVQLLLARISLELGNWSEAEEYANNILSSPNYSFQQDLNEVFHFNSSNIIWQLVPKNNGDATNEAVFYYFTDAPPNAYALSLSLINSFQENDLRKTLWTETVQFNDMQWMRPYKYKNLSGENINEYSVIFRLEEVYFIMAEALIRQNRLDEACYYLNFTRQRAGLSPFQTIDQQELLGELAKEKRREFFTESGMRFADLKRWNMLQGLIEVKPNWMNYNRSWPLPQQEILLNPNLNPQNEGY